MSKEILVHLVNPVSGWVTTVVHVVSEDAESAVDAALKSFGLTREDLGQTLKAIPQIIGEVADEEVKTAESVVESEPVPVTVPAAVTEAETTAARVLAALPPDVAAAIKALQGSE
jgi:hypothetical protein